MTGAQKQITLPLSTCSPIIPDHSTRCCCIGHWQGNTFSAQISTLLNASFIDDQGADFHAGTESETRSDVAARAKHRPYPTAVPIHRKIWRRMTNTSVEALCSAPQSLTKPLKLSISLVITGLHWHHAFIEHWGRCSYTVHSALFFLKGHFFLFFVFF